MFVMFDIGDMYIYRLKNSIDLGVVSGIIRIFYIDGLGLLVSYVGL